MHRLEGLFGIGSAMAKPSAIAGYRVVAKVAEGPWSTIFKCESKDGSRFVVVKVLSQHAARAVTKLTKRLRKRWEGERAQTLIHPNVVRTLECGQWEQTYYVAMEFVPGGNLSTLIERQSPLLIGNRVRILAQTAHGIFYIHQQGIIHRDICPKNVMLAEDATPKLIDFGVAMDKRDVLRNTGARTGRPSYMAPELIRENIFNERTDIYAFGVTMYETLTGRKPFESADRYSTMHLQLNVNPFPPSRHNPEITPELEAITLKAMAKDAAARYRSMDELYVALTALRGLSI